MNINTSLGKCHACGKDTQVVCCCSTFGAFSNSYCLDCVEQGIENYNDMVVSISLVGRYPEDVNPTYIDIIKKNLKYHNKTEEEFAEDVAIESKSMEMDMIEKETLYNGFEDFGDFNFGQWGEFK